MADSSLKITELARKKGQLTVTWGDVYGSPPVESCLHSHGVSTQMLVPDTDGGVQTPVGNPNMKERDKTNTEKKDIVRNKRQKRGRKKLKEIIWGVLRKVIDYIASIKQELDALRKEVIGEQENVLAHYKHRRKKSRKYLGKKEKTMRGTKGRKDGDSNFIFSYALLF